MATGFESSCVLRRCARGAEATPRHVSQWLAKSHRRQARGARCSALRWCCMGASKRQSVCRDECRPGTLPGAGPRAQGRSNAQVRQLGASPSIAARAHSLSQGAMLNRAALVAAPRTFVPPAAASVPACRDGCPCPHELRRTAGRRRGGRREPSKVRLRWEGSSRVGGDEVA